MRKFLLTSAALALVATSAIASPAKADPIMEKVTSTASNSVIIPAAFYGFLGYLVVKDVQAGGMNRKLADMQVTPGAGYKANLQARLENSPELARHVANYEASYGVNVASAAR